MTKKKSKTKYVRVKVTGTKSIDLGFNYKEETKLIVPLPTNIKIAAFDFAVVKWTHKEATAVGRFGECSTFEQVIRLDESLQSIKLVDTLIHEIGHAIYWAYCIEDGDKEERVVSTMATAWTQVFRDNPYLVKFISNRLGE